MGKKTSSVKAGSRTSGPRSSTRGKTTQKRALDSHEPRARTQTPGMIKEQSRTDFMRLKQAMNRLNPGEQKYTWELFDEVLGKPEGPNDPRWNALQEQLQEWINGEGSKTHGVHAGLSMPPIRSSFILIDKKASLDDRYSQQNSTFKPSVYYQALRAGKSREEAERLEREDREYQRTNTIE